LVALCSIAGRIGLGILIGHTNRRIVAASGFAISAVGLGLIAFGATPGPLLAGCVLVGLAASNLFLLPPLIAQAEFQSTDVARVVALVTSLNQITLAFAPAVSGLAHDLSGNYVMPFLILTFAQVIAGAAILLGGRSR
jgi:CP family cyanate transporter-like MFS transporter